MKLYFENSEKEEKFIAECETIEQCHKEISKFLADKNYKSYYSRVWKDNNGTIIDVGSHSEFFKIYD